MTARGLANWYAQTLGTIFTDSPKPFEVEIVVAEVAEAPAEDQIYRITFDGSVNDEHGYVAMGGQAEAIATVLKEHYSEGMNLTRALAAAIAGLAAQANGDRIDTSASQLEVAVLERTRAHRTFRRLTGARLESLPAEASAERGTGQQAADQPSGTPGPGPSDAGSAPTKPADADVKPAGQEGQPDSPQPGQADSPDSGQPEPGGDSAT